MEKMGPKIFVCVVEGPKKFEHLKKFNCQQMKVIPNYFFT